MEDCCVAGGGLSYRTGTSGQCNNCYGTSPRHACRNQCIDFNFNTSYDMMTYLITKIDYLQLLYAYFFLKFHAEDRAEIYKE